MHYTKGSPLHPQWLSDRDHRRSRRRLARLRDARVLDIGSGDSLHHHLLAPSNRLVRLDYPATNRRYQVRPELYGDACRLPIAEASMDAVLLLEVLEHLPCPEQALAEAARVLRSGGQLYLSAPFIYPLHDVPHDYYRFTLHGLRHLLRTHALEPVEELHHGNTLTTALQMVNLALLDATHSLLSRALPLGILALPFVYLMTLTINLLALPLTALPWRGAASLGHFVIARRGSR